MATREDYLASKVMRLTEDCGSHKAGTLWCPYFEKDDESSRPGFVRAGCSGPVRDPDWDYLFLSAMEVVPATRLPAKPEEELASLWRDTKQAMDILPTWWGRHFQARMLEAVADECRRVATLLREG
jgi:hypothetical protein